jgi:hypothetical protein
MKPANCLYIVATIMVAMASVGYAQTGSVYDNTSVDTGGRLMLTNNQVVGEQLFLDHLDAYPTLSSFSFEFYSPSLGWSGSVQSEVKFYKNDGVLNNGFASPGTLFYDTGLFDILNPRAYYGTTTNVMTLTFNWPDLYQPYNPLDGSGAVVPLDATVGMPSNFTMVFSFTGLTNGVNDLGLPIFQPPTVGTNYGDYWIQNGASWQLVTNNLGPVAFGVQLIDVVPEPSVSTLEALGVGIILVAGWMKRRK